MRFAKYRGLKSWRSSPWDPREELPREYARVFAFQNFTRAHKRCRPAPSSAQNPADPQMHCGEPYAELPTIRFHVVPGANLLLVSRDVKCK